MGQDFNGGVKVNNTCIKLEDIPIAHRAVAKIVGVDAFINLCREFGGSTLYLPTTRKVLKPVRDEEIKREFNGSNIRELATKHGICETQVRKILFK